MSAYNLNTVAPKPTFSASAAVAGQAITVTSTATKQFSAFNVSTDFVVLDIQNANTFCTFDGTTPSSGAAHILSQGNSYTWSRAAALAAKFVATTTTNCVIYASQFQT